MLEQDWRLLESLFPGVSARGRDERYWLERSAEVIALSTQDRGLYPVLDHSRGEGTRLFDLAGNE